MSICLYLLVCLYICPPLYSYLSLAAKLLLSISPSIDISISVCNYFFICSSTAYPLMFLSLSLSISPSICYLSIHPSVSENEISPYLQNQVCKFGIRFVGGVGEEFFTVQIGNKITSNMFTTYFFTLGENVN